MLLLGCVLRSIFAGSPLAGSIRACRFAVLLAPLRCQVEDGEKDPLAEQEDPQPPKDAPESKRADGEFEGDDDDEDDGADQEDKVRGRVL